MNRPIGFDLSDLTADDRRAIRNTYARPSYRPKPRPYAIGAATKRPTWTQVRRALVMAAQVAGGAVGCIGVVAWFAVWLGV